MLVKSPGSRGWKPEVYAEFFKTAPPVSDQGIQVVVQGLAQQRPLPKDFAIRLDQFRDNGPLEKLAKESWIEQLYK